MGGSTSRQDWEELPSDPDLREDLGYELLDLEAYETDGDRILFLPKDEDMIRNEAFIVAQEEDVCSLGE
jgi:hypothetical protein